MVRSFRLGLCEYRVDYAGGYCETRFPDGLTVPATASEEQRGLAERLGYGSHVFGMVLEHEYLHTAAMVALGYPWSPVLRAVAGGKGHAQRETGWYEEDIVLHIQRLCNRPVTPALAAAPFGSTSLAALRGRVHRDLRG